MKNAAARSGGSASLVNRFHRIITGEVTLGVVVLLSVGVLTSLPPARVAATTSALSAFAGVDDLGVALDITPGRVELNTFTVRVTSGGQPVENAKEVSWLDQLLGVQSAVAHSIPSDWWSVPVTGGQPERLTAIFDTAMYADIAPDGQRLIFVSATGLYVMDLDGSDLQRLLNIWTGGTVDWAP